MSAGSRPAGAATDDIPGLGRVEQLVLRGDGLTTTSLEVLTGTVISVRVLRHWVLPLHDDLRALVRDDAGYTGVDVPDIAACAAVAFDRLDVGAQDTLLVREILLTGDDGVDYGASAVVAVLDRLPAAVAHPLAATDEPIGRMLREADIPVLRELGAWGLRPAGERAGHLGCRPQDAVPARDYVMRLVQDGRPLAAFTEWFAPRLFDPRGALDPRGASRGSAR